MKGTFDHPCRTPSQLTVSNINQPGKEASYAGAGQSRPGA